MRHKYKTAEKRNILNISLYCVCIRLIYTPCYGVYTNWMAYTQMLAAIVKKIRSFNSNKPKYNKMEQIRKTFTTEISEYTVSISYIFEGGMALIPVFTRANDSYSYENVKVPETLVIKLFKYY